MADLSAPGGPSSGFKVPSFAAISRTLGTTDIGLALGVMGIIVILIVPLPALLLDVLLAISIVFSVMILMTALFIQKPLEFSSFP
ncbi:MAG: EscV/YscV/HrcV family type III secretion system export apparatus protein, partial [Hyphomicrobiales bacterium]